MMTDLVGQQLGNYRLTRLLGAGAFAQVYLGEHVYLKTLAAVKVLYGTVTGDDLEDFLKEAQIIARLDHPHIVRVFDFGVERRIPFLIMSYAPNGTLRQRYCEGSQLPPSIILSYLKQVASALQYAHQQKLVHRDVKPQNMLIGLHDEILLSDFGLATVSHSMSYQSSQNQAGTLPYMAPELFQSRPMPASDQYALGVVVYEWLCGAPPFHGSDSELAMQQQFATPPPLHEHIPDIPAGLEHVVLKALAKDPRDRFPNVQAFAAAFEQASKGVQLFDVSSFDSPPIPTGGATFKLPSITDEQRLSPRPSFPAATRHSSPRANGAGANSVFARTYATLPQSIRGIQGTRNIARIGIFAALLLIGAIVALLLYPLVTNRAAPLPPEAVTNVAMFGFDPQHSHFNPYENRLSAANVARLQTDWTASTSNAINCTPAVVNGVVYIGSYDHKLYAFNASSGALLWSATTGAAIWGSSPAVVNGIVYVGSEDHKLYAFNAATGKLLWSALTGDAILSSPAIVNGVVYIGSYDDRLYAFNAATGKPLWSALTGDIIHSSPAVVNGTVYVGSGDHKLYAFNATTGKLLWSALTNDGIDSSPAVANGIVYVGSKDDNVYAFNTSNGRLVWSILTGNQIDSSPAIANGIVYIGSQDHKLYALNASNGETVWSASTDDVIDSDPMVAGGVVYISADNHKIYAFNASSGQLLWSASTSDVFSSSPSPVVVNGVVYEGAGDGKLYAFHLPGATP